MKIAVTIWEKRISPVFDSSGLLLIVEINNDKIISRREEPFNSDAPFLLVNRLNDLNVNILICGAISQMPATVIEQGGVLLIPFIGGIVNDVLDCCAKGNSPATEFLLPGCGRMKCCRQREQNIFFTGQKEVDIMPKGEGKTSKGNDPLKGKGSGSCNGSKKGCQGTGQAKSKGCQNKQSKKNG